MKALTTNSNLNSNHQSPEKKDRNSVLVIHSALRDDEVVSIPSTMVEALEWEDPVQALKRLSEFSAARAAEQAEQLQCEIRSFEFLLPDLLKVTSSNSSSNNNSNNTDHPLYAATAGADSIRQSLHKIASGGSQASQEIRLLEQEKRELEQHAEGVQMALTLRLASDQSLQAMQTQQWQVAAEAVKSWLDWTALHEKEQQHQQQLEEKEKGAAGGLNLTVTAISRAYAGEYCLKQLATTHARLKETLLQQYEAAVSQQDLGALGQLTPILSLVQLEPDAVRLYLQFLKSTLDRELEQQQQQQSKGKMATAEPPPFVAMARVYNTAVACLRHHLPMVSHCLYKADGDAAVVQLVHVNVEQAVLPMLERYQQQRQLAAVYHRAQHIAAALEERYTGRVVRLEGGNGGRGRGTNNTSGGGGSHNEDDDADDCGFSVAIGSLSDADAAMEEAARCLQCSESYLRFIHHTCDQIQQARRIRFEQAQRQAQLEREREEWNRAQAAAGGRRLSDSALPDNEEEKEFVPLYILPDNTPLHMTVAEVGGQYAGIERCLLLASMQRAFVASEEDPKYYHPLSLSTTTAGGRSSKALQTSVVEACLYAARHGSQRALATGHTGTASAMTNFCSDCLTGVLLEVLSQRAEESGVTLLKPGEGLLVGAAGLLNNATNLIRHGTHATGVVVGARRGVGTGSSSNSAPSEEILRKQKVEQDVARACATLNDLEVAVSHIQKLEVLLTDTVNQGFPPDRHETEQLRLCVQQLSNVSNSFLAASNAAVKSLESVLKSRLRSIVGEAIGGEGSSSTFMGSSVVASDRGVMVRMNHQHHHHLARDRCCCEELPQLEVLGHHPHQTEEGL